MLCDELRRPRSKETLSSVASCELCNKTNEASPQTDEVYFRQS